MSEALDRDFQRLAEELGTRIDPIVADGLARIRAALPEWTVERPDLDALLRDGAHASIGAELEALRGGALVPDALPPIDAEGARICAQAGLALDQLLFLYRAGHAAQWQAWLELVESEVASRSERRALLERGSAFFFAYADRMCALAAATYDRERDALVRGHEQRRVHLVRELLDGRDVDAAALDYPLERGHIGVVAAGPEAATAITGFAQELERRLLLVELLQERWWAWLAGDREVDPPELARVVHRLDVPAGTSLGVGDDLPGVDGFRESHRQADRAHELGRAAGAAVTAFEDVALEALGMRDAASAASFARRELSGIDGDDGRSARLRSTLAAYFAHGQNAAAAGAAQGVHEQTVAKRLRTVEERTGRPVAARRAELETALRLRARLGGRGP